MKPSLAAFFLLVLMGTSVNAQTPATYPAFCVYPGSCPTIDFEMSPAQFTLLSGSDSYWNLDGAQIHFAISNAWFWDWVAVGGSIFEGYYYFNAYTPPTAAFAYGRLSDIEYTLTNRSDGAPDLIRTEVSASLGTIGVGESGYANGYRDAFWFNEIVDGIVPQPAFGNTRLLIYSPRVKFGDVDFYPGTNQTIAYPRTWSSTDIESIDWSGAQAFVIDPYDSGPYADCLTCGQVLATYSMSPGPGFSFTAQLSESQYVRPQPANIDVQPFDTANEVKPSSNNPIIVAVHSTNVADGDAVDFDATQVDPATLKFGLGEAPNVAVTPWVQDLDGDSDSDVMFAFRTQDTGILCGDTEATLTGETYAAASFIGTDPVMTTDCVDTGCHP